jgi:uncharacterized protein (DUF1501 family)
MQHHLNRREFLRYSTASLLSASFAGSLSRLNAASTGGSYKALVCILLEGGADTFNMIIPNDTKGYNDYQKVRRSLAVSKADLLPFTHRNQNGKNPGTYAMRDTMRQMRNLFQEQHLAIVANVGTLVRPTTADDIRNKRAQLPFQLFAHNTQRALWMQGDASGRQKSGWAGRAGDLFYPTPNPYFNVTVDGPNLLQQGGYAEAITFDSASISPDTMKNYGFGPEAGGEKVGRLYQKLYESRVNDLNRLMRAGVQKRLFKLNQQEILQNLFDNVAHFDGFGNGVHEEGKPLGKQLEIVAQILSVKDNFPNHLKRQIFFVNHHGWDTHNSDNKHQSEYLSQSLGAFYDALKTLGIENEVTTFTISDFGRTLTPNGSGSDHGWGGDAFVMGGAVRGGDIYGSLAKRVLNSPDAWEDRTIPTTSVESYLAPILTWFGTDEAELEKIFPNIRNFPKRRPQLFST